MYEIMFFIHYWNSLNYIEERLVLPYVFRFWVHVPELYRERTMLSWFADNIQIKGTVLNTHIHPIKMRPTDPNPEIAELHKAQLVEWTRCNFIHIWILKVKLIDSYLKESQTKCNLQNCSIHTATDPKKKAFPFTRVSYHPARTNPYSIMI